MVCVKHDMQRHAVAWGQSMYARNNAVNTIIETALNQLMNPSTNTFGEQCFGLYTEVAFVEP